MINIDRGGLSSGDLNNQIVFMQINLFLIV